MGNKHLEIDFPTGDAFAEHYNPSKKPRPKVTRGFNQIVVSGITLHRIEPPIDEANASDLQENLEKLGIKPPPGPPEQADFLHLVPAKKTREPKKINPPWHGDPQPAIAIITNVDKRRRALSSDAAHHETVLNQERRKNLGLPEKALNFKERLQQINALTPEDLTILETTFGYKPERIHQYAPITQELMLHKLNTYKEWRQDQTIKV